MHVPTSEFTAMQTIEALELNVRSYSRSFPGILSWAHGSIMLTEGGRKLIDFLSGAGTQHLRPKFGRPSSNGLPWLGLSQFSGRRVAALRWPGRRSDSDHLTGVH